MPSEYLAKLEKGDAKTPSITSDKRNVYLRSHLIDPSLLRGDSFESFMVDRQKQLLGLIEKAKGRSLIRVVFRKKMRMLRAMLTLLKPN